MTMMLPRWLLKASTVGRANGPMNSFSVFATSRSASTAATNSTFSQLHQQQQQHQPAHMHQQQRFRWTKAKKKRFARYDRRQLLEKEGIPLTKPPYYFPIDTPVVGAVTEQDRLSESAQFDEAASAALASKQAAQKIVLRHHMSDSENAGAPAGGTVARTLKLQMSDRVRQLFDLHNGCQKEVVQAQKKRGMELFQMRPGDTGSSAVQVIALTTRIQQLQTHFGKHKKDKHSKRGMDALYVRRRKLLDYMERKDFESYRKVVKTLGLVR
jgi:small subunit ribosomal protein S15